jgi:hypothetical protein
VGADIGVWDVDEKGGDVVLAGGKIVETLEVDIVAEISAGIVALLEFVFL